jgi:hypothetical protein
MYVLSISVTISSTVMLTPMATNLVRRCAALSYWIISMVSNWSNTVDD